MTRNGQSSLTGLRPEIFQMSLPDGFDTAALNSLSNPFGSTVNGYCADGKKYCDLCEASDSKQ
jgi:hypothetical protein